MRPRKAPGRLSVRLAVIKPEIARFSRKSRSPGATLGPPTDRYPPSAAGGSPIPAARLAATRRNDGGGCQTSLFTILLTPKRMK